MEAMTNNNSMFHSSVETACVSFPASIYFVFSTLGGVVVGTVLTLIVVVVVNRLRVRHCDAIKMMTTHAHSVMDGEKRYTVFHENRIRTTSQVSGGETTLKPSPQPTPLVRCTSEENGDGPEYASIEPEAQVTMQTFSKPRKDPASLNAFDNVAYATSKPFYMNTGGINTAIVDANKGLYENREGFDDDGGYEPPIEQA